ncbi:MAG TPA: Lrp/AsnC family transcriptional regulator, partial [Thiotrichales bacterium]|nr:Lrp/AsnC family transcriptional regulator [Thiotrichales bacterium]
MHNLDKFDLAILDELQRHGRLTNQELAERIGLSPSPCLRRVKALEDAGIITGYQALVDREKLGLSLMAL